MADTIARGGRAIYGVSLGILMLEARFPRIPGDMGNAETWPFPVQLCVVEGATPERIVLGDPRDQLDRFIRAGRRLIELGVSAITTNCGFLALLQPHLANALGVPVATSSLMQALTPAHLAAVGAPADTPVAGTENGAEFFRVLIKADSDMMDIDLAEHDVVEAARTLVRQNPDIGASILECTNMPPYAAAVAAATGLPVYDIYSMVTWFVAGIRPRIFSHDYSRL